MPAIINEFMEELKDLLQRRDRRDGAPQQPLPMLGVTPPEEVTAELLRECDTIVLNVRADNPPALSAYRALGYRAVTEFEERLIHRQTSLWDSIIGPVRALVSDLRRNG